MTAATLHRFIVVVFCLLLVITAVLLLELEEKAADSVPESVNPAVEASSEAASGPSDWRNPSTKVSSPGEIAERSGAIRGPVRTGTVILKDRVDRFVPHFENGPADPVAFDVELLDETFPVALTEFERVPGSAGSGVFFGFVEGEPHSRVSWAFHGDAEVGEIQIHGQDTLKILPVGTAREHRVMAWDPMELRRCAQCLAQEQ